ncbi:cytochrome P450 [Spartinivicinus ruber]|uniref:cytochrome P450 n=1 Tax=Spartinivicinus ruber TaxID=2683272 RepID=UPI0013D8B00D|nr:cytochrome P450 [Spartinivicinus ruber]
MSDQLATVNVTSDDEITRIATSKNSYLAELDAADDDEKFKLVRQWIDHEPLAFFKALRKDCPILVTPKATLVTRLDDCVEVLNQPKVFTVALYEPKMDNYLMSHDDDAFHTREKSIMQGFLNRNDLPRVRTMVRETCIDLLNQAAGNMELVGSYCRMVPATLVQNYFGLTGVDREDLIEWSYWNQADTFYNQPFDNHTEDKRQYIREQHERTGNALAKYITELMVRRVLAVKAEQATNIIFALWYGLRKLVRHLMGEKPEVLNDDIVTRMIRSHFADTVEFDLQRVGVNAGGLLIGAIETTSQAVAQSVQFLLDHPEWLAKAKSTATQADTTAFDDIVWETLRFVPISPYLFREAASEAVIARGTDRETTIPAGGYVLIATQSAMFDERAFDEPEQFRPGRNWYHQFHFGYGEHQCLGRYVGAEMIPEMVRQVVLLDGLNAEGSIDYEGGHLPQRYQVTWSD